MAVVPGICGIAVYSPKLNEHGNSVRSIEACTLLSQSLNLHVLKDSSNNDKSGRGSINGASMICSSMMSKSGKSGTGSLIGKVPRAAQQPTAMPRDVDINASVTEFRPSRLKNNKVANAEPVIYTEVVSLV
jgi:hypothetical protein